jgi:hypothetical protein
MKQLSIVLLLPQLLLGGGAAAYPIKTEELAEISSTNQILPFIRSVDRIELEFAGPTGWFRDGKNISQSADVFALTNAAEVVAFVHGITLKPNPKPCCCSHQYCIVFWQKDAPLLVSICGKCFSIISRSPSGKRTVTALQMPSPLWERFEKYRLLHRRLESHLVGVSETKDGEREFVFQGWWKLIYKKTGEEIEGFRIDRYDPTTQRVLLVCPKSGRELWIE